MSSITPADVRAFVLDQLDGGLVAGGVDRSTIDDDTDLLDAGIIDSMRIVQLLALVEDHFPIETDWDDYDPEDILVVGPFCAYVARHVASAGL